MPDKNKNGGEIENLTAVKSLMPLLRLTAPSH